MAHNPLTARKHPKYYVENGDLHIVVERTAFRVHRFFFERDSPYFHRLLNPAVPGDEKKGTSDLDPLVIDDVPLEEFEMFLWIFYNPQYSLYDAPLDTWKTILALSNRWEFQKAKDLAVRELHKHQDLSILDKLALYSTHKVSNKYLVPLFAEFCRREHPVTLEEGRVLGLENVVFIGAARERLRSSGDTSPLPEGLDEREINRTIEQLLGGAPADQEERERSVSPVPTECDSGPPPPRLMLTRVSTNGSDSSKMTHIAPPPAHRPKLAEIRAMSSMRKVSGLSTK